MCRNDAPRVKSPNKGPDSGKVSLFGPAGKV